MIELLFFTQKIPLKILQYVDLQFNETKFAINN